ncbi:glycosyltransferase family 39 protein [Thioclava litoralis]|uniref:Glycosyltransferase family 39 protein n=1 Tax=Thioclava litoralis TaxID=3076557 RepID=A0ABZ1E269_9RHOB|nr:glycosyltransferase family 39 protein [Thioclava sp. FTW29]
MTAEKAWWPRALAVVALITALRLLALAFNKAELFVDETQYWFWGQNFDFGYYSKPPLIGWLIRAVTDLAGSSSPFWVRMPGAVLHGVTALVLGLTAARLFDARTAFWTALTYVTLPFVALGSLLISTDTVMAPFFAGAILFFVRTCQTRGAGSAVLTGLCAGAGFMAKYAAIYLIPGALLAALVLRDFRPGWRNSLLMVVAFGGVIAPNVLWNLTHDLTTVEHTMDNAGWVRTGAHLNWGSLGEFFASQFGVFGPVSMLALLWGYLRPANGPQKALALLSIPALAVVLVQALLDRAYANWAVGAYFAGTILAVSVLAPRWRRIAVAVNLVPCVLLPVLTLLAPWPEVGGKPLLQRYLGRAELSKAALSLAHSAGLPLVSDNRDVLADLFYQGRDGQVPIYAVPPEGRPRSYYEQMRAMPEGLGPVLLIATQAPAACQGGESAALPRSGYWARYDMRAWYVEAECLYAR